METRDEYETLRDCGISLMQGYLLARPELEALRAFAFRNSALGG